MVESKLSLMQKENLYEITHNSFLTNHAEDTKKEMPNQMHGKK